jgi:hypothetical protein
MGTVCRRRFAGAGRNRTGLRRPAPAHVPGPMAEEHFATGRGNLRRRGGGPVQRSPAAARGTDREEEAPLNG